MREPGLSPPLPSSGLDCKPPPGEEGGREGTCHLSAASESPQQTGRGQEMGRLLPHPCSTGGSSPSLPLPVPGVSAVSPSGPAGPPSPAPACTGQKVQGGGSVTGRLRRQLSNKGHQQQQLHQLLHGGREPHSGTLPGGGRQGCFQEPSPVTR